VEHVSCWHSRHVSTCLIIECFTWNPVPCTRRNLRIGHWKPCSLRAHKHGSIFWGFHQHGYPKRMFYNGKSQSRMDDLGVALILGNLHLLANLLIFLFNILSSSYMLKIFIVGRDWFIFIFLTETTLVHYRSILGRLVALPFLLMIAVYIQIICRTTLQSYRRILPRQLNFSPSPQPQDWGGGAARDLWRPWNCLFGDMTNKLDLLMIIKLIVMAKSNADYPWFIHQI